MSDENLRDTLVRTVDRIAADLAPRAVREAAESGEFPLVLWAALEEVGLPRAWLGEEVGGAGLDAADTMLALRRTAYHGLPVPLAETLVAGRLLAEAGIALPDGPLSLADTRAAPVARLRREGGGARLAGTAARVPWADDCAHLVLAAVEDDDSCLVLARIGDAVRARSANLAGEPRHEVALDAVEVVAHAPLAEAGERILLEGALARSVQIAGALEAALDIGVRYAGERVQFGRPIAKFQAVQHMLALAAGQVASARAAADLAVEAIQAQTSGISPVRVAIAKARTGEAAARGAEYAHQVLGAIGFTREHSLHWQTRRLWSWRDEFGNEAYWHQQLGRQVAQQGADALWPLVVGL